MSCEPHIEQFLRTGDHDPHFSWSSGQNIVEAERAGRTTLLGALTTEVRKREAKVTLPELGEIGDQEILIRAKLEPIVRGLFPRTEHEVVLDMLCRAFVFVTPDNIEDVLRKSRWLSTAWDLACIYLSSIGAEPLSEEASTIVGLSDGSTCYVSMEYFQECNRFADYVVHEAAHVFHNCKRETIGLTATRRREWLLEIEYAKRETFAYAIEAYSRIMALRKTIEGRKQLLAKLEQESPPADERVDLVEYLEIVSEAVVARNGWKSILRRCSSR